MSGRDQQEDEMQELRTQLAELQVTVAEIHTAIVGNPRMGHVGLAKQVAEQGRTLDRHDRNFLVYTTGAIVGSTIVGFVLKLLHIL